MNGFWTLPLRRQIGLTVLTSLGLHGAYLFIQWYVVSPIGHGGVFLLNLALLHLFPLLAIALAIPAGCLGLLVAKTRRYAVAILTCGPLYILIAFGLVRLGYSIRMDAFARLAERSESLVGAVHRYVEDEGHPPPELEALVPHYLPRVPDTGMPAYPTYEYSTGDRAWRGNPWVIEVPCTSGGINFDRFTYFPNQNYPQRGQSGSFEKVGRWAYYHE